MCAQITDSYFLECGLGSDFYFTGSQLYHFPSVRSPTSGEVQEIADEMGLKLSEEDLQVYTGREYHDGNTVTSNRFYYWYYHYFSHFLLLNRHD